MAERQIIQHLRTNELNVKPDSSNIEYGEIAINYKKNGEKLFIKNDSDEIIEFRDKTYIDNLNNSKQDKISDLETIRNNAAKGATALQVIPDEYITETELQNKGYITSIPSEYVTATQLQNKGYLTSIPDEYVTETELQNKGYLTGVPSEYITESELNNKGLATVTYVNQEIGKIQNSSYDDTEIKNQLANKADKTELFSKSYNDLTDKPTIPSVDGLASEEFVREEIEAIDYVTAVDTTESIDNVSNDFVTSEQLDGRDYATNSSVNSQVNTVNDSIDVVKTRLTKVENLTSLDMRASVLWLGTSIPSGDINIDPQQNNTYPRMVADALGFDLYNMAKAGSFVAWYPQAPAWTTTGNNAIPSGWTTQTASS